MYLGGALYKILGKRVVEEESFTTDWKEALDVYMKHIVRMYFETMGDRFAEM